MKPYEKVVAKLEDVENNGWHISGELFGDTGAAHMFDFLNENYCYFLDNVDSNENLIRGLEEISPFADDALAVAQEFTLSDFKRFKDALATERRLEATDVSNFPDDWLAILLPARFILATMLAENENVPLGTALIRIAEVENITYL